MDRRTLHALVIGRILPSATVKRGRVFCFIRAILEENLRILYFIYKEQTSRLNFDGNYFNLAIGRIVFVVTRFTILKTSIFDIHGNNNNNERISFDDG